MARYIDADKLLKNLCTVSAPTPSESWIVEKCIEKVNEQPSADVVPESEVDRLVDKWIGEEKLTQDEKALRLIEALQDEAKRYERYYFNHEYDKLIAEAEQEVAKKIFDEIDELLVQNATMQIATSTLHCKLAELKKKYTESEEKT